jgi:hypothetical protein
MASGSGSSSQPTVQGAKRSRADFEADGLPQNTRRPRGRARTVVVTQDAEEQQIPQPQDLTQLSVEDAFAKIRGYLETF